MDNDNKDLGFRDFLSVSEMYQKWYIDYASYVILERAIPRFEDGLKPVQRRILHAMHNIDDGRFHKVANVIGQTMQFHPHGDAAINDALVGLGQKELLVDTQGNWGDHRTGDRAAASRYIETRLTDFAKKVTFNKNVTDFIDSYDGRNKEPEVLPVKFPILLYQGTEGIAVSLSTKILPHNFTEIIKYKYDDVEVIAGVATGAIGIAMLVAQKLNLPFIYVRPEAKNHGRKNQIEGKISENQKIVVIEDLISTGKSSLNAVKALRESNLEVLGMIAIFTYGLNISMENFQKNKVNLDTLSNYNELINKAIDIKYISEKDSETLKKWNEDPENWS